MLMTALVDNQNYSLQFNIILQDILLDTFWRRLKGFIAMSNSNHRNGNSSKQSASMHDIPRKLSHHVSFDHSEDLETETRTSSRLSKNDEHSYSADYSDFESETNTSPRRSRGNLNHESASADYLDDFETDTKASQQRGNNTQHSATYDEYTEDFESDTRISPRPQQKEHSKLHSVSSDYTEDFESDTWISSQRPRTYNSQHSASVDYTDDFESDTKLSPRISPRRLKKISVQRSTSLDYSDDFESDAGVTPRLPNKLRSVSFQYSEDDDDDSGSFTSYTQRYSSHILKSPISEEDEDQTSTFSIASKDRTLSPSPPTSSLDSEEEEAQDLFVKNLLKNLKRPKPSPRRSKPKVESAKVEAVDPEVEDRTQKFCEKKIRALRSQDDKKKGIEVAVSSCRMAMRGLAPEMNVCESGISPTAIERLKLENTLHNLRRAANTKIHEPFKCPHCREHMSAVAAEDFIRKKKAIVEKNLVEEKMEKFNAQCNDPFYLMGEILQDLPKLDTNPLVVTQKLMKPMYATKEYIEPQDDPDMQTGNAFWRTFFSRLKEHPGKEYMNLYEDS